MYNYKPKLSIMDIGKLGIVFYRDFEVEYFDTPKNAYISFAPFDLKQKYGTYPKTSFRKKDPMTFIVHKDSVDKNLKRIKEGIELFLHEDKETSNFVFRKVRCKINGFDHKQPLLLWVEYLREPTFILYKIKGFGTTKKSYFVYKEFDDRIFMQWTDKIRNATVFSHDTNVDWREYHADLVATQKKF
jgi:hypothetical protein